jgi:hypothetical protein
MDDIEPPTIYSYRGIVLREALAHQGALGRGEILTRPAMSELAHAREIALTLLLSQDVPLPRGLLKGLGQHGTELGDRFHVLRRLPSEPFTVLASEAESACQLIGCILNPLRGSIHAALHGLPSALCRLQAEVSQLFDAGSGSFERTVDLLLCLVLRACMRIIRICHFLIQSGVVFWSTIALPTAELGFCSHKE